MSDTYDSTSAANADANLPPLTAAIRKAWADGSVVEAAVQPIANGPAMRAILDAIHSLENRVIALEP